MSESKTSAPTATPANKGAKHGLPATGLPAAETAVAKLWAVARLGTASPEAFARQFGDKAKASGSTWDTRIAVLRGFKLVRFEGRNIGISQLGQQLVNSSDPSGQTKARQTAVMNLKAYRELVEAFEGTPLPEKVVLATKLQFEYGKTEEFAQRAAQAFMDSLAHAEMLDQGNIVRKDGVSAIASAAPSTQADIPVDDDDEDEEIQAEEIDRAFEGDGEVVNDLQGASDVYDVRMASKVTLALTLDLSNFRTEEVIEILSALGLASRG